MYAVDSNADSSTAGIDQLGTVDGALTHLSPPEVSSGLPNASDVGPLIARSLDGKSVFVAGDYTGTNGNFGGTQVARLVAGSNGTLSDAGAITLPYVSGDVTTPDLHLNALVAGPPGAAYVVGFAAGGGPVLQPLIAPGSGGLAAGQPVRLTVVGDEGSAKSIAYDAATNSLYVAGRISTGVESSVGGIAAYAVSADGTLAATPDAVLRLGANETPAQLAVGAAGTVYADVQEDGGTAPDEILPLDVRPGAISAGSPLTLSTVTPGGNDFIFTPSGPAGPSLYFLRTALTRIAVAANGKLTLGTTVALPAARGEEYGVSASDDGKELYVSTHAGSGPHAGVLGAIVSYRVSSSGAVVPDGEIDSSNAQWVYAVTVGPVCGSADAAADRASTAAASAGSCPLSVTVKGSLTLTSGLAHRPFRNPDVARFFSGASETSSEACQSGCTDLTVTVTDPNDHTCAPDTQIRGACPAAGVKVRASVQPIGGGIAPYPSGEDPGKGYLCLAALAASADACGNGSREVDGNTDDAGQLKLRYWAPGVLKEERVLLTVKASTECSPSSCRFGSQTGEVMPSPTLIVKPNVVIGTVAAAKTATLDPREALDLAQWTAGNELKHFNEFLANHVKQELIKQAIKHWLEKEAEGPLAIVAFLRELNHVNEEELGFMGLLLTKLGVRSRGLGIENPDAVHRPGPEPGKPFLLEFASDNGPFTIDDGGLTWRYGEELAMLKFIRTQTMHLRVYEVSFCRQGEVCGPGYSGNFAHRHDGIRPFLYFDFHADRAPITSEGETSIQGVYSRSFIVPYNAEAWMQSQFGG